MAILRTFIRWWVWWGENTFYYYSRPFVWLWRGARACLVALGNEITYPQRLAREVVRKSAALPDGADRLTDDELLEMLEEARQSAPWKVHELQLILNSPRRVAIRYYAP